MTAHDPRVTLTEAERDRLAGIIKWHGRCHADQPGGNYLSLAVENVEMYVEGIIAARLAPIRALAEQWNDTPDYMPSEYDRGRVDQRHDMTGQLYEALDAPVNACQDRDGAVHNHPPYRPPCNERFANGRLRGACLNDDGSPR